MNQLSCDFCAADFIEGERCSDKCGCVDCELKRDDEKPDYYRCSDETHEGLCACLSDGKESR